jgi:hypothetical protein
MARQNTEKKIRIIKLAERDVIINKKAKPGTLCSLDLKTSYLKSGEKVPA